MLLWLNGPFGGGKTQTAHELQRRIPGSIICDPELVGEGLHRMMPRALRNDFQDFPAWRAGVFEVLDLVLSKHPGTVIVPMTVVEPGYFSETVGKLSNAGHDVRHFALLAGRETVLRRLRERGFGHAISFVAGKNAALGRESFAVANLDKCLDRLQSPTFAQQLWTDQIPISKVAERIAADVGLDLLPNVDSALRGRLRRGWTGVKHIRFGA